MQIRGVECAFNLENRSAIHISILWLLEDHVIQALSASSHLRFAMPNATNIGWDFSYLVLIAGNVIHCAPHFTLHIHKIDDRAQSACPRLLSHFYEEHRLLPDTQRIFLYSPQ